MLDGRKQRHGAACWGSSLAFFAASLLPGLARAGDTIPRPPTFDERRLLLAGHAAPPSYLPRRMLMFGQDGFDVLDYELSLALDVSDARITGTCAVTFVGAPGVPVVDSLVLNLHGDGNAGPLVVTAARLRGSALPLDFSHLDDALHVSLDPPWREGQPAMIVEVEYEGTPLELGNGTLVFGEQGLPPSPLVHTFSEPFPPGQGNWQALESSG